MTRDELIETMARAMDAAAGTHSAPPFSATWGEHAAAVLTAIETAGLAIVPVEATSGMVLSALTQDGKGIWPAMIEAGRI